MPSAAPSSSAWPPPLRSGADHFLQRDDVGVDRAQHGGDPLGTRASVEAAAAMHVVGRDAQRRRAAWIHYAMIVRASSRRRLPAFLVCIALAGVALAGCRERPPVEPLKLDGNMLTVDNRSSRDWTDVEIWLNRNHSVRTPSIPAGGRLQVPLDTFVAGFGQRFDYRRTQITDLRLTAKLPDGTPLELKKQFTVGGLEGALGGKR